MPTITKPFDPLHDTKSDGASVDETVIRVPLLRFELPNPSGTSLDKYEPAYVLPLMLALWKPRFQQNPDLKPIKKGVPGHLPQYRDITDVDGERSRLAEAYGYDRSGTALVDVYLPGDRLWQAIKDCGEYVTRRTGTHHSVHIEDSAQKIPEDATPYDLITMSELIHPATDLDEQGEVIDTEVSAEKRAEKIAEEAKRQEAKRVRQEIMAKRLADENARATERARTEQILSNPSPRDAE